MAATVAQSNIASGSASVSLANTVTGRTFVVSACYDTGGGTNPTLADNQGNSFTGARKINLNGGAGGGLAVWVLENGTGGTTHTFTVSGVTLGAMTVIAIEVDGAPSASYDSAVTASGVDSASPYAVTSGTPAQADELFCGFASIQAGGTFTYVATSWTSVRQQGDNNNFYGHVLFSRAVTDGAAKSLSVTASGSTADPTMVGVIGIKSAGAAGVTCTLAVTDTADTLSSAATVAIVAVLGVTDAADALSSASLVLVLVAHSATDADDSLASTAVVGNPPTTCDLAVTDAADTLGAAALVVVAAALASTDAADALASGAGVVVTAALGATDEADTLASIVFTQALAEIVATLAVTDEPDTLAATLAHEDERRGHGGRNAGRMPFKFYDDFYAPPMQAALAVTDADDTVGSRAVASWVERVVSARIADADDVVQAGASVVPWPALALVRTGPALQREGAWRPTARKSTGARQ